MREANLNRLSEFTLPSRWSGEYIYYRYFFNDLKDLFNKYIKEGASVFDIGCGNKPFNEYILKLTNGGGL
jgi:hypothetical protein